jgi:hypothetical protein
MVCERLTHTQQSQPTCGKGENLSYKAAATTTNGSICSGFLHNSGSSEDIFNQSCFRNAAIYETLCQKTKIAATTKTVLRNETEAKFVGA